MRSDRYRLPVAALAALAATAAAALLIRPRGGLIEPAVVEATAYFSAAELERAHDFRSVQRALGLAGVGISGAALALLALRPPRRLLDRLERRPLRGAAVAGAGLSLVLLAVNLPIDALQHGRAVDVGLSTQDWGSWLGDLAKTGAIGGLFTAGGAALAVGLYRRWPRRWWLTSATALVAVSALFVYLSPLVIEPLFNRFEALPEGRLRSEVLVLAERAEVEVGEIYRVDASRRTTGANAYVGGLGQTKRVVLYDNLIDGFTPAEVRSVVAHELAHVKYDDVPRGLLYLALVAPAGLLLVQRIAERLAPGARGPELVPALALALALVSFAGGVASSAVSRRVEARADAFALRLTGDAEAFISLERRLALQNVSDPDPPRLLHRLFGTHPTTIERLGFGVSFRRGTRAGS